VEVAAVEAVVVVVPIKQSDWHLQKEFLPEHLRVNRLVLLLVLHR
jgi:hypothetical protein